jgi:excinuclease ABC subunit B
LAYKELHGVTPQQIVRNTVSILGETKAAPAEKYAYMEQEVSLASDPIVQYMNRGQLAKAIERVKKQMTEAAKKLDFIEAAQYRDEMVKLQGLLDKAEK